MNILIIAHHFPPLNKVGTYRIYSFAKEWIRQGHQVTVLTTKKYSFDGDLNFSPNDIEYETINIVEVEYGFFFTKHFKKNNVKHEWTKDRTSGASLVFIKKIVRYLRRTIIGSSFDIHDLWINNAVSKGSELLNKQTFDFMISSYAPPSSHIVAAKLKKKNKEITWVSDYRDLWNGNHFDKANIFIRASQSRKETKSMRHVDIVTTVSDPLNRYLQDFLKKKTYTIENGFDTDEMNNISKAPYFPNKKGLVFVYSGTIYPSKRDPTPFFKAIKRLEKSKMINHNDFKVLFFGDNGNLKSIIKKEGVHKYVDLMGMVSKQDSLRAQRDSDGLLFLEWEDTQSNSLSSKGVLTGKLFEYLASGTEIFAVGITENSIAGDLISKTRTGKCYGINDKFIYNDLKGMIFSGKKILNVNSEKINLYKRSSKAKELTDIVTKYKDSPNK